MSIVGENIRKARIERGWTQDELAQRMGYKSKSTVTKVENGVNDINLSKVIQYANVLGVYPAYLMGWEDAEGNEIEGDVVVTHIRPLDPSEIKGPDWGAIRSILSGAENYSGEDKHSGLSLAHVQLMNMVEGLSEEKAEWLLGVMRSILKDEL